MLRLFSELLQSSQQYSMEDGAENTPTAMKELCAQSSRVLEPMVRCLVDWVKTNGDVNDEDSLQYVQKTPANQESGNGKQSLIQQRSAKKSTFTVSRSSTL